MIGINRKIAGRTGYRTLVFSNILLIILPVIITITFYVQSVSVLKEEIKRTHSIALTNFRSNMDSVIVDIDKLALNLTLNREIKRMRDFRKPFTSTQRNNVIKIINELKTFSSANKYVDTAFIYFNFYEEKLSLYRSDYSDTVIILPDDKSKSLKEWKDYLSVNDSEGLRILQDNNKNPKVCLVKKFPENPYIKSDAYAVLTIRENAVKHILDNLDWISQGSGIITDRNNKALFTSSTGFESIEEFRNHEYKEEKEKIFITEYDGNYISYTNSEITDWKYYSVLSDIIFFKKARQLNFLIIIILALCLVSGGLLAFYLAGRNYSHVGKILAMLDFKSGKIQGEDDFHYIENTVSRMMDENKNIKLKLYEYTDLYKTEFLRRLVRGVYKDSSFSIDQLLKMYNIDFLFSSFFIVLISSDKVHECDKLLNDFCSNTYFTELSFKQNPYILDIEGNCVLLINTDLSVFSEIRDEYEPALISILKNLNVKYSVSVSVSELSDNIQNIPDLYYQCMEASEFKLVKGEGGIIFYSDIVDEKRDGLFLNRYLDDNLKIVTLFRNKNYIEAKKMINSVINKILTSGSSLQTLRIRLYGLINIVADLVNESGIATEKEFAGEIDFDSRLMRCSTIPDFREIINTLVAFLDKYITEKTSEQKDELLDSIRNIVKKDYSDINLGVSTIADRLDLEISYLSRFFKKQSGQGLHDFIQSYRIEKAKKLLRSSISVKATGEKVGYSNDIAFIRAFKKVEGITPGKFTS